jgi:hypothetical protein
VSDSGEDDMDDDRLQGNSVTWATSPASFWIPRTAWT